MSAEKQIKNAQKSRNVWRVNLIRFGQVWLCALALSVILFFWYFWSRAGEYEDRYAVLAAMLRLKLTDEKVVLVGGRSNVILVETQQGYQPIFDNYMKSLGWQFVDRMGSGVYFRKGNQELEVRDFSLTVYFRLHGLGSDPHKLLRR